MGYRILSQLIIYGDVQPAAAVEFQAACVVEIIFEVQRAVSADACIADE
jgi:hypothetical protein